MPYLEVAGGGIEEDGRKDCDLERMESGECLGVVGNLRWDFGDLGGDSWMKEGEGKNQSLSKEGDGESSESRDMVGFFIEMFSIFCV